MLEEFHTQLSEELSESSMALVFGSQRLTTAEIFDDFIPGTVIGTGTRKRKFRVDGYQIADADNSVHLAICDQDKSGVIETITQTDANNLFGQLTQYVEECMAGSIWDRETSAFEQQELSAYLQDETSTISRFRFHLFTNRRISKRLELKPMSVGEIKIEPLIWDIERMFSLSQSRVGSEEFVIDFTRFTEKGLPCLAANETEDYQGYLAVIDGQTLASIYDEFGSRILEGNVRAYLSARGKVNKGIQNTIRSAPEKFFAFNNGISCTSTEAEIEITDEGAFLKSARYLQIVNGGQTTASIFIASRASSSGFSAVSGLSVQMKLSVIKPDNSEALEDLITNIARFSNTQNTVKESDFFSNHEFHRLFESAAQSEIAPPIAGETNTQTYWFYERARGSYDAKQMILSAAEKRNFLKLYPRAQRIEKTDIAKFIHAWNQRPHDVCDSGQRNFKKFAEDIIKSWGENGSKYRGPEFFKETIAKAVLYRRMERIVDKADWYPKGSGYRQGIVAYSIALLSYLLQAQAFGGSLDFKKIWQDQRLSPILEEELNKIGQRTTQIITAPAYETIDIQGLQWFKKEECWTKLKEVSQFELSNSLLNELLSADDARERQREKRKSGGQDAEINDLLAVTTIGQSGWSALHSWSESSGNAMYGSEADLVRLMRSNKSFVPSPKQARILYKILTNAKESGFSVD